jgi:hypothetical protein
LQTYAYLEAAHFEARHRHNATAARQCLEKRLEGTVEEQTRLRAEAATLLAEERHAEAADKVEAALTMLPRSTDPGGAIAEKDWLMAILIECKNKMATEKK